MIGPTFHAECLTAGVTDFRFSFDTTDDAILYHPDVVQSERDLVDAALIAHDGELSQAKYDRTAEFHAEAETRIAALYSAGTQTDLLTKELNQLASTLNVVHILAGGATLDAPQLAIISAAQATWAGISAIRVAEAAAVAAVAGAANVAAVNAVVANWPP